jgi:transposase-like protein
MADIPKKSRRPRRQFDEDFKAQALRLVLDERRR